MDNDTKEEFVTRFDKQYRELKYHFINPIHDEISPIYNEEYYREWLAKQYEEYFEECK